MKTHAELVAVLAKPGEKILNTLTPVEAHILHMLLGLSGEVGELIDGLKKAIIYQKPLDTVNIIEELGDIEFYLEGIRAALSITREETITANCAKLEKRYGEKYSDEAAQARRDKK